MIILKLIAFDDRPNHRLKDPLDINSICTYYPQLEDSFIWGEYFHLYTDEKTHEQVGIEVLGYEVNKIIRMSPKLKERILNILDKAISEKSDLAALMINDSTIETITMKIDYLKWLKYGIIND